MTGASLAALVRPPIAIGLAAALLHASCAEERAPDPVPPVYDVDVAPILARSCRSCHGAESPAAGWSVATYLDVIACTANSARPVVTAYDPSSPILRVLDTDSHRSLLDAPQRDLLRAWVMSGAHAFRGTVHSPDFVDPRAPASHGNFLRERRWAPMLDARDENACGRCHDGAPARPSDVTSSAPRATACTSCHEEPGGALACGTCHGSGAKSYPPRDPCFFPSDGARGGAHAAHVEKGALLAEGLPCSACHPVTGTDVMSGLHGNGGIEIVFDESRVGPHPSYDRSTGICSVSCHDRGGARARPAWSETSEMRCGDCHGAPPARHYAGACTQCHAEADATGMHLSATTLHMNGKVDLGDGSGTCGACHGRGDDPWPTTQAHGAHAAPAVTTASECTSCHVVPSTVGDPGHLDGMVQIRFSGRAVDRGARATWNGQSCQDVACHGAELVDPPPFVPVWSDRSGVASTCDGCHRLPPTGHTASGSCDRGECHGSEIVRNGSTLSISESGKLLHVNGRIDTKPP